jgi:MFS family permease
MIWTGLAGIPLVALFALMNRRWPAPAPTPEHAHAASSGGWGIAQPRRFTVLSVVGTLDSVVRGGTLALLAFLLADKGLDTTAIAAIFTTVFVAGALGKLGCGPLGARFGTVGVVAITELATAATIVAFVPAPSAALFALAGVFGFFLNGTSSVLYAAVSDTVSASRQARGYALYYTLTLVSSAIAPVVFGAVADVWGLPVSFWLLAFGAAIIAPLATLLRVERPAATS